MRFLSRPIKHRRTLRPDWPGPLLTIACVQSAVSFSLGLVAVAGKCPVLVWMDQGLALGPESLGMAKSWA